MVVKWALPPVGHQKYNTDENPGPSSYGFCIRSHRGNLSYAQAGINDPITNIQIEAITMLKAIRYWEAKKHAIKTLETDSLVMVNIIKGNWMLLWVIIKIVEKIQKQIHHHNIHIQHIYREGNQLVDFIANQAADDEATLVYTQFQQLSKKAKQILNTDKAYIPNIMIKAKPIQL